jgi:hypothetical protein
MNLLVNVALVYVTALSVLIYSNGVSTDSLVSAVKWPYTLGKYIYTSLRGE